MLNALGVCPAGLHHSLCGLSCELYICVTGCLRRRKVRLRTLHIQLDVITGRGSGGGRGKIDGNGSFSSTSSLEGDTSSAQWKFRRKKTARVSFEWDRKVDGRRNPLRGVGYRFHLGFFFLLEMTGNPPSFVSMHFATQKNVN